MLNRLTFYFSLLAIVSCSENKSGKMKDLDSIRSKSTYHQKKKIAASERGLDTLLTVYNQDSVELNIQSIQIDSTHFFFHEFNALKSAQLSLVDSVNHTFQHQYAQFKLDSVLVKNNFFNWFDREFCQRNLAIRICSRFHIYPENIFFVCTNQSIHAIKSKNKIDPFKWVKLIQLTEKHVEFIYICHQPKNKQALWYKLDKNKLILIPA
jgi:hypothetical protein